MKPRELFCYILIILGMLIIGTNIDLLNIIIGGSIAGVGIIILTSKPTHYED